MAVFGVNFFGIDQKKFDLEHASGKLGRKKTSTFTFRLPSLLAALHFELKFNGEVLGSLMPCPTIPWFAPFTFSTTLNYWLVGYRLVGLPQGENKIR